MEAFLSVTLLVVGTWYFFKGVFYVSGVVWKEISPAVFAVLMAIAWFLDLLLTPFIAVRHVAFGYPETIEERQKREEEATKGAEESERRRQLEDIKKAIAIE